ncbi:hypothetical protein ASE21_08430 [Flavobacterium sp. Root901]|uniref:hypothetical protein n=1 Tax=Flavobacterium sp. Root901 TaxID=1736605 RepID=UPI00070A4D46|nr:hypothetical protein [Flavobacterium sp. Root901]KRD11715.1 hypothetical protein ASE21_08430 [Flavobacterium sp. Root901]
MKKIILFLTILVFSFSAQAQKEAYNWYFGAYAGFTFNATQTVNDATGTPVPNVPKNITSMMSTNEGCFALSNPTTGETMVYSDGMAVYNKNNAVIATGLNGNSSSAQSGILLPWPGKPNFYFIISNSQFLNYNGGLYYSVFEDRNNGIVTNKNVPLNGGTNVPTANLYENTMAVRHANGIDYWLVNRTGPYLLAWLVTKDGFPADGAPTVVSAIPGAVEKIGDYSEGYLKMSSDGKTICHANLDAWGQEIMLADFDNATGKINNVKIRFFSYSISGAQLYGVEFSPDGKNLFLSNLGSGVWVMPTADFMTAPGRLLSNNIGGAMQLGPDGRIYVSQYGTTTLGIIPNPNDVAANVKVHILNNYLGGTAKWGLPTFPASIFDMKPTAHAFACTGNNYKFTTTVTTAGADVPVKLSVDYGDSTTEVINLVAGQSDYSFTHAYALPGTYTVKITPLKAGDIALTPTTLSAEAVDCLLKTNRMIRVDLKNTNTLGL